MAALHDWGEMECQGWRAKIVLGTVNSHLLVTRVSNLILILLDKTLEMYC